MGLSTDLISQFAKLTTNKNTKPKETTVYGVVKEYGDSLYVQLDGSELLTPVSTMADAKVGERVAITIKNHTATVTGNASSPAARTGDVIPLGDKVTTEDINAINANINSLRTLIDGLSNKITTEQFDAVNADIENLRAEYAQLNHISAEDVETITIKAETIRSTVGEFTNLSTSDLEAINASISNLIAYNAKFTYVSADILKAVKADISQLDVDKLSVKDAELTYANIDFSNIKMAAVEELFARSGIIKDLVVGEQSITGELVGVTIKGDLIEANTLKADRLLLQGEDGLYYKLNVDSLGETTASSDEKYQTGLDGSIIIAESITADKIRVTDLVAFDATIGGFKINDNSIHSVAKTSVDNTTRGIYYDNDGQIAFGDSDNYVKFHKDYDNKYRLDIAVSSTNFARFEDNGVLVGDLRSDTIGNNILIDGDSVDIRIGDAVLASYQGKTIYLGKNSKDSVIDLCDGTGTISNYDQWGNDVRTIRIESNGGIDLYCPYSASVAANRSFFDDDNHEISLSSSISLWTGYGGAPSESDGNDITIYNGYRKTVFNNDTSNSYTDSDSTISLINTEETSLVHISNGVSYEDYLGSAYIDLSGDYYRTGVSRISLNANQIEMNGDVTVNMNRVLLASKGGTSYYGMLTPEGSNTGWIRTTSSGLIPYSQDSTNGASSIGSSSWPFSRAYIIGASFSWIDVSGVSINSSSNIVLPNGKAVYGKKTDGSTTRSLLYVNGSNACVLGYGGYNSNDGETLIYGKDVKVYSKTANANFKPYYAKGDSISSIWWIDGFVSSEKTKIYLTIPLAKPVIGSPTVTVTSGSTYLTVRQGGSYIYGSASGAGVTPSSYSAELNADGNAVKITAIMKTTTGATNNDTCAVSADIKITFS